MANNGLIKTKDGINQSLTELLNRMKTASAYADTVIWPLYQQAQIDRWESENASQGSTWKPISATYAKRKRKKFAAYPGGGNALMVATGRLASGAQGRNASYFYKLVTDQKFTVAINTSALPYAVYPAKERPYMEFSEDTTRTWTQGLAKYLMTGRKPG